jgi:hypothetical protein
MFSGGADIDGDSEDCDSVGEWESTLSNEAEIVGDSDDFD